MCTLNKFVGGASRLQLLHYNTNRLLSLWPVATLKEWEFPGSLMSWKGEGIGGRPPRYSPYSQ